MDDEQLFAQLEAVLNECRSRGMVPPFIMCAMTPSGSVIAFRTNHHADRKEPADMLAQNFEHDAFRIPFLLVVLDQHGKTLSASVDVAGNRTYH